VTSEFLSWFTAQHGPRCKNFCADLDQALADQVLAADLARAELEGRKLWDEKKQSALYAWCARDGEQK